MVDNKLSNMSFRSNLQPIGEERYYESPEFLKKIRDPFALEYMHNKRFPMTDVQNIEYEKASGHCSRAFKNDYPWGTVVETDGTEKVVCKCLNLQCRRFSECNPDFDLKDLAVLIENEINAYLRYIDDSRVRRSKPVMETPQKQELENAYRLALMTSEEEEPADITEWTAEEETELVSETESVEEELHAGELAEEEEEVSSEVVEEAEPAPVPVAVAGGFERFIPASHEDVLNAAPGERMLINAGPGTGKTWTLIHKIASLVRNDEINPEDVLVLSFSRAAVEEIEKRLREAEKNGELSSRWRSIDFSTLDSFATRLIIWARDHHPELLPEGYELTGQGYDARINTAREIIKQKEDILESNVHVLIDEIQDLVGCRAQLVLKILTVLHPDCGFTLLGDACQSLYDYQAEIDSSVMSSALFYKWLFKCFPNIKYYRFDENHRQSEWLRDLIAPYRDAILTGTPAARRDIVNKLQMQVMNSFIDLKEPSEDKFNHLLESGTVAVLTRSNGEALKISEYMKNAGIKHRLERPDTEEQMNDWIADVFTQYPNETINYELFCETVEKVHPDLQSASVESCWKALTENVKDEETWYHVSNILETLQRRGKNRVLFRYGAEESGLTVSNIHRAKGKEYDTVIIPEHFLDGLKLDMKDPINEHKVCYVACTRPREMLKTAKLKNVFVSRERRNGRCFEGKFKKHSRQRYLVNMEVGLPGDIDVLSLAKDEIQNYIRDKLKPGDPLILIKEIRDGRALYSIHPENDPEMILGYMSADFSDAIERIKQLLVKLPCHYDPIYYPSEMDNIVVTKKTSCIATGERKLDGIRYFGNAGIWYGFAISGFAHTLSGRH